MLVSSTKLGKLKLKATKIFVKKLIKIIKKKNIFHLSIISSDKSLKKIY